MFPIKPGSDDLSLSAPPITGEKKRGGGGGYSSDEELRSVGVWTGVCHGKKTWFRVLQFEILVCEFLSINGFSTRTTTLLVSIPDSRGGGGGILVTSKVSSLEHEIRNHTMKSTPRISLNKSTSHL